MVSSGNSYINIALLIELVSYKRDAIYKSHSTSNHSRDKIGHL